MKAIQTRILPATDTKPSRIKAMAEGVPSLTVSRNQLENTLQAGGVHINEEAIHQLAARKLASKYDWDSSLASGGLPDGDWAHCFIKS